MTFSPHAATVASVRDASRRLVREFGFLNGTLAGTTLPASAVHALVEIGARGSLTASDLAAILLLDKSSISRMVGKLVASGHLAYAASPADARAKILSLTDKGAAALRGIHAFAETQVITALAGLPPDRQQTVRDGLDLYARALAASRTSASPAGDSVVIESGFRPGLIGRIVALHADYYHRTVGFGRFFEAKVAAGMAEFAGRLDSPRNRIWSARRGDQIVGGIAIDGEDLGGDIAHLRWFIVADGQRGAGIGRALLSAALDFCDGQGFAETHLWTFRGLEAARVLYEGHGFVLAEEQPGHQWGSEVIEQRFVRSHP